MPHATFSTLVGTCVVAWNDVGLTRFLLPDPERPSGASPEAEPPDWVMTVITRVQRHFTGDLQDFTDLRYDFSRLPAFVSAVLRAVLQVKPGTTTSYGELATLIGQSTGASRAVGTALGSNPWPLLIPCHRVVAASGKMTGFSGPGGVATKLKLLALEGSQLVAQ